MNDENGEDGEQVNTNNHTQFDSSKMVTGIITKKKAKGLQKPDLALSNLEEKKPVPSKVMDPLVGQKDEMVCRICLGDDNEVENPLFSPCKCSGSMKYIHQQCLKTWFSNKRIMKNTPVVSTYFWKNLECELCKTPYPYEVPSADGKKMLNIIDYDTPQSEYGEDVFYIVLESISSNTSKVIHVVNMSNTVKLYIGRGHDAHVRVTDISVSRLHAVLIKSTQGYYFLTDNDSKFGTLALVKTPLELQPDTLTTLQIGRTLFDFEIKNTNSLNLASCLCLSTKNKKPNS